MSLLLEELTVYCSGIGGDTEIQQTGGVNPLFSSYCAWYGHCKYRGVLLSSLRRRWASNSVLVPCCLGKWTIYRCTWWYEKSVKRMLTPTNSISYFLTGRDNRDLSLEAFFINHLLSLNERETGLNENSPLSEKRSRRIWLTACCICRWAGIYHQQINQLSSAGTGSDLVLKTSNKGLRVYLAYRNAAVPLSSPKHVATNTGEDALPPHDLVFWGVFTGLECYEFCAGRVKNYDLFLSSSKGCSLVSDRQLVELFRVRYQVVLVFFSSWWGAKCSVKILLFSVVSATILPIL